VSRKRQKNKGTADSPEDVAPSEPESPTGGGKGGHGKLPANPELEAALREAEESLAAAAAPGEEATAGMNGAGGAETDGTGDEASAYEVDDREQLERELVKEKERNLRLQAEFENFRKRTDREKLEARNFGPQNLVKDLLSVVDNLERAISHARDSEGGDLQGLLQGVELVERELRGTLGKHHVSEVDAQGKPFDPAVHEAMAQVVVEGEEPNTVVEVLQKGYQLRDRLVRPARVVVTKIADSEERDPAKAEESAD